MNGILVQRSELSKSMHDQMLDLLSCHFHGVTVEQFNLDLQEKNWIVLLKDADLLVGFSTFDYYGRQFDGRQISVVFSGDTIMSPCAWNSPVLPRTWIQSVLHVHEMHGQGDLYWLLITSGYRTYRFLPVFWQRFCPCFQTPTSMDDQRLMDLLAWDRFGELYNPKSGVVRLAKPQVLSETLRMIPEGKCQDPHIAYFQKMNPNWQAGDELVSLTKLEMNNLTPAGRRMVYGSHKAMTR